MGRSTDGGATFTPPTIIAPLAQDIAVGFNNIAADSAGSVSLVWNDLVAGNYEVFFSRSIDGGATFSPPQNLSNSPNGSFVGGVAVDASGNIYTTWLENDDASPDIIASDIFLSQSMDGGATFSTPQNITNSPAAELESDFVAVDPSGTINIVFSQDAGGGNQEILFMRSTDGGSTFSPPVNLSNNSGVSQGPRIAVDVAGDIYVIWEDDVLAPGNTFEIFFTKGTLTEPVQVVQNLKATTQSLDLTPSTEVTLVAELDAAITALGGGTGGSVTLALASLASSTESKELRKARRAAIRHLRAFVKKVRRLSGEEIQPADAEVLIHVAKDAVRRIKRGEDL